MKFTTTTEYTNLESGANASNLATNIGFGTLATLGVVAHAHTLFSAPIAWLGSASVGAGLLGVGTYQRINSNNQPRVDSDYTNGPTVNVNATSVA